MESYGKASIEFPIQLRKIQQNGCGSGGWLFEDGQIARYILIPGLEIEHLFRIKLESIRLWVVGTLAPIERAVIKLMRFLKNRNSEKERLHEYVLLSARTGKRTTYRYLTSGMNPIPFRDYYGRILPTTEELIRTFPNSQDLMDWLEEQSMR